MGKVYEGISTGDVNNVKESVDKLMSFSRLYQDRDDIFHRDDIINRIYDIINKDNNRAILLVGDKGIGKRAIIEGFINKLSKEMREDLLITLDYDTLFKKASSPIESENTVNFVFDTIANENDFNIILNINNLGHLIDRNCYNLAGFAVVNELVTYIKEYRIRVIATATTNEFNYLKSELPYALDYFNVIKVNELTCDESKDVVKDNIEYFEEIYGVKLPTGVEETIVHNAKKYSKNSVLPDSALNLIDEVCSNIVNNNTDNSVYTELYNDNNDLKLKLIDAIKENNLEECENLNNKIEENNNKILEISSQREPITISETDVLEAIGNIVNVNMSRISANQTQFLKEMPNELKKYVKGQDETIDKIVKNITRNKLGLRKTAHSAGNFMFIGSTGVGKTYLAKQLAKYLYGSEDSMLRFDMSEYQSEIDVSKLLGSAPGYIGYKESGLLVKRLAKHPESVILFDEIEKAHQKIYDVLLQLLDEGFVTGSDGVKVDATQALIIFTSNVGVKHAKEMASPMGYSLNVSSDTENRKKSIIESGLKKRFSPEFLNRLDNICYFNSLDRNNLKDVLYRELDEMNNNIKNICGKKIEITEDVENWILNKVEKDDNGARPIIRHLQQDIEEELSTMIVEDNEILKSENEILKAYIENDKIVLK